MYVEQVRIQAGKLPFLEAVEMAVYYCIRKGILQEFLSRNRAEVIAMSIFEYNEEQHIKNERDQAYLHGFSEGEGLGIQKGEDRLSQLLRHLDSEGRMDDIRRALSDPAYRADLY